MKNIYILSGARTPYFTYLSKFSNLDVLTTSSIITAYLSEKNDLKNLDHAFLGTNFYQGLGMNPMNHIFQILQDKLEKGKK